MEANILGHDQEDCGVEVYDKRGNRHVISIEWDGSIDQHATKDYPLKPEDRTEDEQRIMTQVEQRARYEAHQAFPDQNVLPPSTLPETIERGIAATQQMPADAFADVFREYYHAVVEPEAILPDGVSLDQARAVSFEFAIDGDQFHEPGHTNVLYATDDGVLEGTDARTFSLDTDYVKLYLPAGADLGPDLEYPQDFFALVQTNLVSQIRDRYLQMGEEPPEQYQVDTHHLFAIPGSDETALME